MNQELLFIVERTSRRSFDCLDSRDAWPWGDKAQVNFSTRSPAMIAKKSEMPLLAGEKKCNKGTA